MGHAIRAIATQRDVTFESIEVLASQLADDPDLWDEATETLTDAGLAVIIDELAAGPANQDILADLGNVTVRLAAAEDLYQTKINETTSARHARDELRSERNALISEASRQGHTAARIGSAADLTREMTQRIISASRRQ